MMRKPRIFVARFGHCIETFFKIPHSPKDRHGKPNSPKYEEKGFRAAELEQLATGKGLVDEDKRDEAYDIRC